jgi:hypothetical protein
MLRSLSLKEANMDELAIPHELTSRPQWLAWYYDDDGCKIPIGKSNDPQTWTSFDKVSGQRLAYVISGDDPYVGVDLDDCISDGGDWTDEAIHIMQKFEGVAYAEISPSGTGVKLLTRAKKPEWALCKVGSVECYDHSRFWTMTGNVVSGFESIGDGQQAIDWLCNTLLRRKEQRKKATVPMPTPTDINKRAGDYIASCGSANEGGRNNKAFSIAGHLYGIVGDHGERLSESDVLSWLMMWNQSLPSPMSADEIQSVVRSARVNGVARDDKPPMQSSASVELLDIDWDTLNSCREDDFNDEDFCASMVPDDGLLKKVFDFYCEAAYRQSSVMGLAVAVSLVQTVLGRKVRSHTDLRTNDYNLILASTGSGKEACESTITKILDAADPQQRYMFPPDIQSGNGLMKALSTVPCGIWVCDEFGKILQGILDRKGNHHYKTIGVHLLKLYGKSSGTYGGAAHSDGVRNKVVQPHLCLLGLATPSSVFDAVASEQVSDGLIGRIAFWSVQERPEPKEEMAIVSVPDMLAQGVRGWVDFQPPGGNLQPDPVVVCMSSEGLARWKSHAKAIDYRMREESELRAAIWSRVAARTMKLSLVHRCSRLSVDPGQCAWEFVEVEIEDVDWAIKLSNWLATTACSLIRENVPDRTAAKAKAILMEAISHAPEGVNRREILRQYRSLTAGDVSAAAKELGLIEERRGEGVRKQIWYKSQLS